MSQKILHQKKYSSNEPKKSSNGHKYSLMSKKNSYEQKHSLNGQKIVQRSQKK